MPTDEIMREVLRGDESDSIQMTATWKALTRMKLRTGAKARKTTKAKEVKW